MNLEINPKRKRKDNTIPQAKRNKTDLNNMRMSQQPIETIKLKPKPVRRKLSGEEKNKNKIQRTEENISNNEV